MRKGVRVPLIAGKRALPGRLGAGMGFHLDWRPDLPKLTHQRADQASARPGTLKRELQQFDMGRPMRNLARWSAFVLFLGLALVSGCRPSYQAAEDAEPWPLAERDARETGEALDCWPSWRGPDASGVAPGGSPPAREPAMSRLSSIAQA